ncbi:MAG: type II secretion system protein M [Rhodobacteraceae bacterium]|nr:type II secretion system protein M [Paracoccaceae bacterium]
MIKPGTPLSRNLAILVAMSPALVAGIAFGVWAATEWRAQGERLERERALAHEYAAQTTQTRQYEPVLDVWRSYASSLDSGLLPGADRAAAEAVLIGRLKKAFEGFDGRWIGAESLPPGREGGLEVVRLEARGEAPERGFARLLDSLETESPYVFVETIDLKRMSGDAQAARLDVRMRLSTYRLSEDQE